MNLQSGANAISPVTGCENSL